MLRAECEDRASAPLRSLKHRTLLERQTARNSAYCRLASNLRQLTFVYLDRHPGIPHYRSDRMCKVTNPLPMFWPPNADVDDTGYNLSANSVQVIRF
jgi:hypothetical protein